MFHKSAVAFARQSGPRVQAQASLANIGTEVVSDVLYGGATVFDSRIVTFNNP